MELHSAGPCYGTQQAAIMDHFVFRSLMGFFIFFYFFIFIFIFFFTQHGLTLAGFFPIC